MFLIKSEFFSMINCSIIDNEPKMDSTISNSILFFIYDHTIIISNIVIINNDVRSLYIHSFFK